VAACDGRGGAEEEEKGGRQGLRCKLQKFQGPLWQNRLNYSGSSALVIAIQPILTQRTSNGITHWSVGSPPDTTTVQQDRSRFTSHERRVYNHITAHQLLIYRSLNIITHRFKLKVNLYKYCLKRQAKKLVQVHSGRKFTRDYTRRGS
jgi:hypothetical protein